MKSNSPPSTSPPTRQMGGFERYCWFAGAGIATTLVSYGLENLFNLNDGQHFFVVVAVAVVVATIVAPIFRRRGGYRN